MSLLGSSAFEIASLLPHTDKAAQHRTANATWNVATESFSSNCWKFAF